MNIVEDDNSSSLRFFQDNRQRNVSYRLSNVLMF